MYAIDVQRAVVSGALGFWSALLDLSTAALWALEVDCGIESGWKRASFQFVYTDKCALKVREDPKSKCRSSHTCFYELRITTSFNTFSPVFSSLGFSFLCMCACVNMCALSCESVGRWSVFVYVCVLIIGVLLVCLALVQTHVDTVSCHEQMRGRTFIRSHRVYNCRGPAAGSQAMVKSAGRLM